MPDTTTLPGDAATTRVLTGATVPYVVRLETGTIDRGVYHIAILLVRSRALLSCQYLRHMRWRP